MLKINFGCGENKLDDGWRNHDSDVDISKPLKFADNSVDFIFCEHCIEHILYFQAVSFLQECARILKPDGIARIAVPSIERVMKVGTSAYFNFTTRWQPRANVRGAMTNLLYFHGHKAAWTASLLEATMFYAGFKNLVMCEPHKSNYPELVNIDGHAKIIGEENNWIETTIFEGQADK